MSTIRRLFFYVVSLVALVVAANGSALLIRYLVDVALGRQLSGSTNTASLGLAMVIVAGPVWALTSGCVAPEPSPATPDAIPRFVPGDPLAPHEAGDRARVHTGAAPRVRGDRTHVE